MTNQLHVELAVRAERAPTRFVFRSDDGQPQVMLPDLVPINAVVASNRFWLASISALGRKHFDRHGEQKRGGRGDGSLRPEAARNVRLNRRPSARLNSNQDRKSAGGKLGRIRRDAGDERDRLPVFGEHWSERTCDDVSEY